MALKEIRTSKGLTQSDVAIYGSVKKSAISLYETGARRMPVETAKKIAPFLGVNWWELYEDEETEESND